MEFSEDEITSLETAIDADRDEINRLRAENSRLRNERDRLVEGAVESQSGHRRGRLASVAYVIRQLNREHLCVIPPDIASALAEHDRQQGQAK